MMNFLFLNSIFLAGLAVLAVPVVLHFFYRGRRRKLKFSTLRFFMREDPQEMRRRKVRHLLLMAIRMLLMALIVLAFTRPFANNSNSNSNEMAVNSVIVIDASASMGSGLVNGAWKEGLSLLGKRIGSLKSGSSAALIRCGSPAEIVAHWDSPAHIVKALENLEPGYGSAPIASGLESALNLINQRSASANGQANTSEIHLFSDFQDQALREISRIIMPANIQLYFHPMDQSAVGNVSINAQFDDKSLPPKARAEIKNNSEKSVATSINFTIDGKTQKSLAVELEGRDRQWFDFPIDAGQVGWHTFTARLDIEDGVDFDNAVHGSFRIPAPIRIMCVSRTITKPNYDDPLFYLHLAINSNPDDSSGVVSPFIMEFASEAILVERLKNNLAHGIDLIIFPGHKGAIPGMSQLLVKYMESGGSMIFFAGPDIWASRQNEYLGDVLPAQFGNNRTADGYRIKATHISYYDREHPVFKLFKENDSGDLGHPVFTGWNELILPPDAIIPARFDNGIPLLVYRNSGLGKSAIFNTSVDDEWSDWPKRRTFLPVIQELALFMCDRAGEVSDWSYHVDEMVALASADPAGNQPQVYTSPDNKLIEKSANSDGFVNWQFGQPGFHTVGLGGDESAVVAVNTAPSESEWNFSKPDSLENLIARNDQSLENSDKSKTRQSGKLEIWKWLLAAGILLLVAEMLLSNRFAT